MIYLTTYYKFFRECAGHFLKIGQYFNIWQRYGHKFAAYFLPAQRYASAGYRDRNVSVRPSVCLSVTRRYRVKTKKASGMISSPSGSPMTLVFRRQISSPNSKGFPPNGGLKQGSVGKIQRFASCNVSISSTGY